MFDEYKTEQDGSLIECARQFAAQYLTEENVSRWYAEGGIPQDVMDIYRTSPLGFLGFSPDRGGPSASTFTQISIIAELTKMAGTVLPFQSQLIDFMIVTAFANNDQLRMIQEKYESTSVPCFCTAISDSSSGSDLYGSHTAIRREDARLLLSGEKVFVANGLFTPYILVFAKDLSVSLSENQLPPFSYWLIPSDLEGITRLPLRKIGQKMSPFAVLQFRDVEIQPEWKLGHNAEQRNNSQSILDIGRCAVCAGSLGLATAAFEDAARHAAQRHIRGVRIGDHQQISLMLVNMASDLLAIETHVHRAAKAIDSGGDPRLPVSLMKATVPRMAHKIADQAMQIFGGAGYTEDLRIARIWADTRGNQFAVGTDEVMNNIAARAILDSFTNAV